MKTLLSNTLAFMAIATVIIGLFGTADAYEAGLIGAWQSFYQSAISVALAAAFGLAAWAIDRRQ